MANSPYVRSALAQAALEYVPPLIRKSLIERRDFREEYGFKTDAILAFDGSDVSIQRSELFDAIREVLTSRSEQAVSDTAGNEWKVLAEGEKDDLPDLVISHESKRFRLPDFTSLSPDKAMRLRSLAEAASYVNLPAATKDAWQEVLAERDLEDEEVEQFFDEFRSTPLHVAQSIRAEIGKGQSSISSLVPRSSRYFQRLVGEYDGSASIREYAVGGGKAFLEILSRWRPYDGFLFSLLLSSHSAMTSEISPERLKDREVVRALESLEKHGDRISQLGAIEVGLRLLPRMPAIEPVLISLVKQIRDDDVDAAASGFKLLSGLFVLVDGELSLGRVLAETPPFFRRLASLAQAALIQRQAVSLGVETESVCDWAYSIRGEQFLFQSFADMRLEPRWSPDFTAASQLKADFCGRLMIAGRRYEGHISDSELHSLLLSTESESLSARSKFPHPYYSGPLEGNEANSNDLPVELVETVEAQLKADEVGPASFIALVNSALIFRVDSSQAELAAKTVKLGKHRLANIESRSQLVAILKGLATVAAVSRGHALADELRILVRRYRRDPEHALSIEEALHVCLIAAASRSDLKEWRDLIGDWLTELAFEEFQRDEGERLHSSLQCLCHAVPELWISCGRAEAALKAYLGR